MAKLVCEHGRVESRTSCRKLGAGLSSLYQCLGRSRSILVCVGYENAIAGQGGLRRGTCPTPQAARAARLELSKGTRCVGAIRSAPAENAAGEREGVPVAGRGHRYSSVQQLPQGQDAQGGDSAADARSSRNATAGQRTIEASPMTPCPANRRTSPACSNPPQAIPIAAWEQLTCPGASVIVGAGPMECVVRPGGRRETVSHADSALTREAYPVGG
jgi:hypothetical protein